MDRAVTIADLEALYRRRYGAFVRVASAIAGDEVRGTDAVQEAFASAISSRRTFRGEASPETWVWRIVIRAAGRAAPERDLPTEASREPESADTAESDHLALRAHIAALPERQRLAVFLRYFADLDYRSIARVLGVEVGTVSASLNAAHATLRRRLEEVST